MNTKTEDKRKKILDCMYAVEGPDDFVYCWQMYIDGKSDYDTLCPFIYPDAKYPCPYGKPVYAGEEK